METVLIAIHLVIVLALAGVVLLQRSEGGGLGMGSSPSSFMTGRGQTNLLSRTTAILGAAFFVTSLTLGVMAARNAPKRAPVGIDAPAPPTLPGQTAPAPGSAPNVLDQLRNLQGGTAPSQ
ncbi:MAG: preprotein translocase subunit SecG [Methylobacterium sp.]|jgi:preprotein translocase subunit SecG|nr:preprotein translocase subunit SecG [Methylobacterium sp.]MCE2931919.1 preprotein translocase subunit SecG [Hyphomicrobiales bacterium]MCA3641619.1 preprotein translocase subunit SecG [Methylobacterium sp.]MCA3645653.1 preprotein translocase subunit SecG [Methylobacterium sp.]MCA3652654.1 preprotein translocase subunit SecG [Methylobacterium sp.]